MSTILVTGPSGRVARAVISRLLGRHRMIGFGRTDPGTDGIEFVRGDFSKFEDLRQLDKTEIQAVIHLSGVTGGCLERDGLLVNVEGTRCLLKYAMARGCRKFVVASSIAAIGIQDAASRPLSLPIADQHQCLDAQGYGFSKYLMEEVVKYCWRQDKNLDAVIFRMASVTTNENRGELKGICPAGEWGMGSITRILLEDVVEAFVVAVESQHKAGVRVMNLASEFAWVSVPTVEILRNWWRDDVDLSWLMKPGNEWKGIFDIRAVGTEFGFSANRTADHIHALRRSRIADTLGNADPTAEGRTR